MASEVVFSFLKWGKDDFGATVVAFVLGLQPALLKNARSVIPATRR